MNMNTSIIATKRILDALSSGKRKPFADFISKYVDELDRQGGRATKVEMSRRRDNLSYSNHVKAANGTGDPAGTTRAPTANRKVVPERQFDNPAGTAQKSTADTVPGR